jgi:hypothetical protein
LDDRRTDLDRLEVVVVASPARAREKEEDDIERKERMEVARE